MKFVKLGIKKVIKMGKSNIPVYKSLIIFLIINIIITINAFANLDLLIRNNGSDSCSSSDFKYDFRIYNYGSNPVNMNTITIKMWFYDDPADGYQGYTHQGFYGGEIKDSNGNYLEGYNNASANIQQISLCQDSAGRWANYVVTLSFTTSYDIPANGGYADSLDGEITRGSWLKPMDDGCNDYSKLGSTTYHEDRYFVIYVNGVIEQEWTDTSGTLDSDTGVEPCAIPSPTPTNTPPYILNIAQETHGATSVATVNVILETPTFTPTFTPTNTRTFTPTFTGTFTPTNTNSFTNTFTPTFTNTPTNTWTLTFTRTNTPTFTPTNTPTYTNTITNTPTNTITNTPTSTRTNTPTNTLTNTRTDTPTNTNTNTPTDTNTLTNTPTLTWTGTPPPTWTPTNTWTNTNTRTNTNTPTDTNTPTNTFTWTNTFTPSFTRTNTNTPTDTNTPTNTPTFTNTNLPTSTNTNTPTNTWTRTNTPTNTNTRTNTNTPTGTYTFTVTNTVTNTNTPTNTWTNTNTRTNTNTPTETYTPTETFTPTNTFTLTNTFTSTFTATDTYTPTDTPTSTNTPTITMTLPPYPYILTIEVYNEAGEKVRVITETKITDRISDVLLVLNGVESNNLNRVFNPADEPLKIKIPGLETPEQRGMGYIEFEWEGYNNNGQDIGNGVYYIKFTTEDGYGHSEVVIKDIMLVKSEQYVRLSIFNSAGELVRRIENSYLPLGAVKLSVDDVLYVGDKSQSIDINYAEGQKIEWDGLNSQGEVVSTGIYEIQIEIKTDQGYKVVASKTVSVISAKKTELFKNIKAYPNPYYIKGENAGKVTVAWENINSGNVIIRVYNISGELIRKVDGDLSKGKIEWDLKTSTGQMVASGLYIIIVEGKKINGEKEIQKIKLTIINKNILKEDRVN